MRYLNHLMLTLALMTFSLSALAGGNELQFKKVHELTTLTAGDITSSDWIPVYDASTGITKKVQADLVATPDGVTASTADLNATTNFEETVSATTSEVTIAANKTLDIATAGNLQIANVAITAGAAEINMAADISANMEVTAATNVLAAGECGKVLTLAHATEFVTTLPAHTAGCKFTIIVGLAPSGADYTVVTTTSTNTVNLKVASIGGTGLSDTDADLITFVGGTAVAGDRVECVSDGTTWFCTGIMLANGGITSGTT